MKLLIRRKIRQRNSKQFPPQLFLASALSKGKFSFRLDALMLEKINALAELERLGINVVFGTDDEVKVKCPFHDDKSPSCALNTRKNLFKCYGCQNTGDIITLLAGFLKQPRATVFADLCSRYELTDDKTIDPQLVEKYHRQLADKKILKHELAKRGIDDKLIQQYRLGECNGRITIPIRGQGGMFVNLRSYLPGAPAEQKFKNLKGRGKLRLFPIDQLKYDSILLCGGELKAIVAAAQLNQYGIGAVSITGGEGSWHDSFTTRFSNKRVWVCLDVDSAGEVAAGKYCIWLNRIASWLGKVNLPLDLDEYPKGDINDFVAIGGQLKPLLDACERWEPTTGETLVEIDLRKIELSESVMAKMVNSRLSFTSTVTAATPEPYLLPKTILVNCSRDQPQCSLCPVYPHKPDDTHTIHPESLAMLDLAGSGDSRQREGILYGLNIPPSCSVCNFKVSEYYNGQDLRLSPQLEITTSNVSDLMQAALYVCDTGELVDANESYRMEGRVYPHPRDQKATLLLSKCEPTDDALATYECKDINKLKIFQPEQWTIESLKDRLNSIYKDLETNVTRIFQRRELHLMVDLTYHSPLLLEVDGRKIHGWVQTLIVGDSSQGKSETTLRLQEHYKLGEKVECKNATVAGLLGGLENFSSGRWFVVWGVIPRHDKRLVILEELKGASTDVIGKLTEMRSSGKAELAKIEKRKTFARTRLIALSNPRSAIPISAYNFGVEAITELIGNLEDIRRFDACLVVSRQDIDTDTINQLQKNRPVCEHIFTSELCRELLLWSWTRKKVNFEDEQLLLTTAIELCNKFSEDIPIIDRGSMRYKLARLSAALACRTFSTETGDDVLVRNCHIAFIEEYLNSVYSNNSCGYADYSRAQKLADVLKEEDQVKKIIHNTPFASDFVEQLLFTNEIDSQDIQTWLNWAQQEAGELLSGLVRRRALFRKGRSYRKSSSFISLLKQMNQNGALDNKRPDFVVDYKEEF